MPKNKQNAQKENNADELVKSEENVEMQITASAVVVDDQIERKPSVKTNLKSVTKLKQKEAKAIQAAGIQGKPKSGKFWKSKREKFSTVKNSIYKRSYDQKRKLEKDIKHNKEISKQIKENKKLENIQKKERREENAKRRLENERKSEVVQIIKNTAKIKRMKKKQLRKIEKRDLSNIKVV